MKPQRESLCLGEWDRILRGGLPEHLPSFIGESSAGAYLVVHPQLEPIDLYRDRTDAFQPIAYLLAPHYIH